MRIARVQPFARLLRSVSRKFGEVHVLCEVSFDVAAGGVTALPVGARSMTDEFRHGTIIWTHLASRSRSRVLAAKSLIAAVVSGITAALSIVAAGLVALVLANTKAAGVALTAADGAHVLRLAAATAVWAMPGHAGLVAAGAVESSVSATVGGLVLALWALVLGLVGRRTLVVRLVIVDG